jgi:hypothetical protein
MCCFESLGQSFIDQLKSCSSFENIRDDDMPILIAEKIVLYATYYSPRESNECIFVLGKYRHCWFNCIAPN